MASMLDRTIAQDGYARVLVVLDEGGGTVEGHEGLRQHFLDPAVTGADASSVDGLASPSLRVFRRLGLALGHVDEAGLAALRDAPGVGTVMRAEMPGLVRVTPRAVAAPRRVEWGLARIGAPALWEMGFRGQGAIVGHLDTGVDARHRALQGAIAHFAKFDRDGRQVLDAPPEDSDEHGTHTAGTIAGRPEGFTAVGVAPEARLASAMVIEGGDTLARVLGGLQWALGKGVRVINASLGLPGQSDVFQAMVDRIRAANVLPVFAVGDHRAGTSTYPGNYHNVLSVGACDADDNVADFSGSQRFTRPAARMVPDVVAPGVDIVSCIPGGTHATMDGTSMAAPHIAGLAALLLSAEPTATADDLEEAIQSSCVRPNGMDPGRGNLGIPDAVRALAILRGQAPA